MAQCARSQCGRRIPDVVAVYGRIGMFIDQQWDCSSRCVEEAVKLRIADLPPVEPAYVQGWRAMKLGSLLMQQVGLSRDVVEAAVAEQEPAGTPIGRTLRDLGLVSGEDVLRALATQAGVRYLTSVNPGAVAHRPGELPRDVVRALGIVPVSADARRREMQVACAAPVPGLAVRALTKLTAWAVEPLLVADETMPQLMEMYASARGPRSSVIGAVCDPLSGPARIAQFAKRRRTIRTGHERCDPYVWVRLDADGARADLLMSMPELGEGGPMAGGIYAALSGLQTQTARLDRVAMDIANFGTTGYKAERNMNVAAERSPFSTVLDSAVDVMLAPPSSDFRTGESLTTGQDLDLAIEGRGFFSIETPAGVRYTRNGHFTRSLDGNLASQDGSPVLGENGPIKLPSGPVVMDPDGSLSVAGVNVGRPKIVDFEVPSRLIREDGVRFRAAEGMTAIPAANAQVRPGLLEQSNVSLPEHMAQLTQLSRGFEALQRGLSVLVNEIDGRAIVELGRR